MKKTCFTARAALLLSAALALPFAAMAQNIAIVNGKPVPKARADALEKQTRALAAAQNQSLPPDLVERVRDKIVMDEIFAQEAEKRGLEDMPDYKASLEQSRRATLTQALFDDFRNTNPVTDADLRTEYERIKAQSSGTEYRARHILVEKEAEAKALIAQIKAGGNFEKLAKKNSKDPGPAANGGDLDFAAASSYVPEFSQAMVKLKKGEMTQTPVKTQFGYHIIRLDDVREVEFPSFDDVKVGLKERMEQRKLAAFRDELRDKAKTDYKFN